MGENTKKITKKEYYSMLKEIVMKSNVDDKDELVTFIDKQVQLLNNKAEKAKVRAIEKKVEGDELRNIVEAVLTEEYQTINTIIEQIDDEKVTKAKVAARLSQLIKEGLAEKEEAKTEEGKKVMVYRRV